MNPFDFVGSMANDTINLVDAANTLGSNQGDKEYLRGLNGAWDIRNIRPEELQIAAEQMGLPPEVLASLLRADQMNALRQMQNIASQGGMDNQAIAANRQAQIASARANRQNDAAIQSDMARRGMLGTSGAESAMRQSAAQESANRLSQEGLQNAAAAQMRALQAISNSGQLASQIAGQDDARAQANRQAALERDRYNTGVRNAVNQFNSNAILGARGSNTGTMGAFGNFALGRAGSNRAGNAQNKEAAERAGERAQNMASNIGEFASGMGGGGGGFGF